MLGAAVFLSLTAGRQMLGLARRPEAFRAWIDSCGPWAPLCLVGLMCFQVVVAVLPGEPIEIGAGVAFGVWRGLALCLAGAAIGSVIIFLFTKKLGIKLVEVFVPLEKIRQLKFLQNNRRAACAGIPIVLDPRCTQGCAYIFCRADGDEAAGFFGDLYRCTHPQRADEHLRAARRWAAGSIKWRYGFL